jgi:hypothetical protein
MIKITPQIKKDLQRFKKDLGYDCNLNNPRSHNEHVMHKKYTDRNPILQVTADKIKVREYVESKIPNNNLFDHRIYDGYKLYWHMISKHLPVAVKVNNASARNMFIFRQPSESELQAIVNKFNRWLSMSYGADLGEWCYQGIKPGIVVEKLIYTTLHPIYRFLCWNGKCHYVHVHGYDFINGQAKAKYCTTYNNWWDKQDVKYNIYPNPSMPFIHTFPKMIEIAEKLAEPFDFVRVDLYSKEGKIYFSELTHYPVSGRSIFTPRDFDFKLGELWKEKKPTTI